MFIKMNLRSGNDTAEMWINSQHITAIMELEGSVAVDLDGETLIAENFDTATKLVGEIHRVVYDFD